MNVEQELMKHGRQLSGRFCTPMSSKYRPEIDYSPYLADDAINFYMELIGILRWIVELGRIDIMVNVLLLSSYSMAPWQGHLDQVFHIFGYLKRNKRATIVFDESHVEWDESPLKSRNGVISTVIQEKTFHLTCQSQGGILYR
jgi:hypothetical protein